MRRGLAWLMVLGVALWGCRAEQGHEGEHEHEREAAQGHEGEHEHEGEADGVHEGDHAEEQAHDHAGGIRFAEAQQNKVEFAVGQVETRELRRSVPGRGIVRPAPGAVARVRAPFAGRLLEPSGGLPDRGKRVEAGESLAVLAPTVDANALPMLRAELSKAKTKLERTRREVERLERLVEQGAVPRKRLLDAKSERQSAEADVEAARERVQQYQSFDRGGRGASVTLRAPTAGTVVELAATSGEYLEPGDVILRTEDRERLRLEVRIAEANAGKIEAIQGVWFETSSGQTVEIERADERFFARLDRVDPQTRTRSVWFEIPGGAEEVAPGQYHRVRVIGRGTRTGPAVPASAILEENGLSVVYVAEGPETFERRVVETGIREGEFVEITGGLEAGDRVVAQGAYYVKLASATSGVGGHHH